MNRVQRVLLVLLVVQAVAWALLTFWGGGHGQSGKPLLQAFDAARVARLVVSDSQGDSVVVERTAEGWGLSDFGGYPADSAKAEGILRQLADLKGTTPAVESDRYHASLEVAPESYQRRLVLYDEGEERPAHEIWIGRSPSPGLVYARVTGSDAVYEVEGLESYQVPAAAAAWIRGRLFEFDAARVLRLALRNRAGAFTAERTPEGWRLLEPGSHAGRALDAARVDGFLRAVSSIYAAEPVGRITDESAGFEAEFRVELGAADEGVGPEARGIRIGAPIEGEVPHRPVALLDSPFAAAVHENSLFRILNETWTDLLP